MFNFPEYHFSRSPEKAWHALPPEIWKGLSNFIAARKSVFPTPDVAIALGKLYARLGRSEEAGRQYDLVESY
ncbi:MAG: hypothetical protein WKF84_26065 [Pyrinomonadaceae bacterium]